MITVEDIEACWGKQASAHLASILNGERSISEVTENLRALMKPKRVVTAEDLVKKMKETGRSIHIRNCYLCEYPLTYLVYEGKLCFDSNCNCVDYSVPPRPIGVGGLQSSLDLNREMDLGDLYMKQLEAI